MGALIMARKNLLKGLMTDGQTSDAKTADTNQSESPPAPPERSPTADIVERLARRPRYTKGAIGAVGKSIADLKSRAITDLDPFTIEDAGLTDRLDDDDDDAHTMLVTSLRDHGQQVPVLVRPHPTTAGRYQIVYGRRRVRALRDLKIQVKAMIRDLDDTELVVAQGQENSARKDLTFIEKANFARQLRDAAYDRKIICDALHVDKTQISRMLSVVDAIPLPVIEAIGAAPSVGRDRWLALARLLADSDTTTGEAVALINFANAQDSDGRFQGLVHSLSLPQRREAEKTCNSGVLRNSGGEEIGRLQRKSGKITVTIPEHYAEGFDEWLLENFDRIHGDWLASRQEQKTDKDQ